MKDKINSIALFGTSADPPTLGHEALLTELTKIFPKVITWASDNPDKKHQLPLLKSEFRNVQAGKFILTKPPEGSLQFCGKEVWIVRGSGRLHFKSTFDVLHSQLHTLLICQRFPDECTHKLSICSSVLKSKCSFSFRF